jgi:type II secretion system protein I
MMRKQQGFTIVELLVAMSILGIVAVGFLNALTSSSQAAVKAERMDAGRVIAESQMEWVKSQSFSSTGNYTSNSSLMTQYPGYTVTIAAETAAQRDSSIQKVTITVSHSGKVITRLQDCKAKR